MVVNIYTTEEINNMIEQNFSEGTNNSINPVKRMRATTKVVIGIVVWYVAAIAVMVVGRPNCGEVWFCINLSTVIGFIMLVIGIPIGLITLLASASSDIAHEKVEKHRRIATSIVAIVVIYIIYTVLRMARLI